MGSKKANKASSKKGSAKKNSKKSTQKREFNPREHELVPDMQVMDDQEIEELYDKYDIDPTNLPTIFGDDASLKGLDVELGDVIKIARESPTAGTTTFYRRVTYE